MSRIMILGYELPMLAPGAVEARSYRTWQFTEALLNANHQVCLLVSQQDNELHVRHNLGDLLIYHRLNMRTRGWLKKLNTIHADFQPNGIVGVMFNSCLRATRIRTTTPIWMDIYGDKLAETQIVEYMAGNDRGHRNTMRYLRIVLRNGDIYSTCSTPQKYALVGQLAMEGRLNRGTMGHEFVYPVLPGASRRNDSTRERESMPIRGSLVPEDSFVVLWAGGYNIWIDPDTLFRALDEAMTRNPNIVFVSVGAGTTDHPDNPYQRFRARIDKSLHCKRYFLRGWQPASAVSAYYRAADVGITLDAFHYETQLGTRTRLIEMMSYGLPVITTVGCELSTIIRDQHLGLTFSIGDAKTFCDHIVRLASEPNLRQTMAERARNYATTQLSFSETTRILCEWARNPSYAPDRKNKNNGLSIKNIEYLLRHVARSILWQFWALERGE